MPARPRIAILGGGVGSVTAAIELSKPGWQKRFRSITLYQQGWRLGGKGASGRGKDMRIEEHGLHIWFGFYENAFRMLDECHRELDRLEQRGIPRWPLVFKSVEDSFQPCSTISLTDFNGCSWTPWTADFFDFTDDRPWLEPDPRPPGERPGEWSVAYYAGRCLHLAADLAHSLVHPGPALRITPGRAPTAAPASVEEALQALWGSFGAGSHEILRAAARTFDALAAEALELELVLDAIDLVVHGIELALDWLTARYAQFLRAHDAMRRAWYVVDIMIAIVRGLIEDDVIAAQDFDVINGIDFCDWLLSHGAREESVQSALVRTVVYDLAFAYRGGDPQRPAAEAGTALRGLLRTFFTYRGALMWKMNSGMGDVVFAPLYELLIKRKVKIEFFHRVEKVRAANGRIEKIEIDVQADVPAGVTARTYLRAGTLPTGPGGAVQEPAVWPNAPDTVLTAGGTPPTPIEAAAVYESWFADPARTCVSNKVLTRGASTDGFDLVVFGLPISCVPLIAPELPSKSPRWRNAVGSIETVATQAMQLWLKVPATELADVEPGIVVGGFFEPFDTWSDMHHLVGQEDVEGSETVAYFCNVLADPPTPPPRRGEADAWLDAQSALVRAHALRFLNRDIATLWPDGADPHSKQLRWELLVAPSRHKGPARLEAQFLRANVEPSERYVLSVPGSSACRIRPDATGFANLYAVGDWTACTLDAGCVEAAAISGITAANGILRSIGATKQQTTIIAGIGP